MIEGMDAQGQAFLGGLAHAGIACASAEIQNLDCGQAALAALGSKVVNVGLAQQGLSEAEVASKMRLVNLGLAVLTSGGDDAQFAATQNNLASQFQHNYLNAAQRKRAVELQDLVNSYNCGAQGANPEVCGPALDEMRELRRISAENTLKFIADCQSNLGSALCKSHISEMKAHVAWQEEDARRQQYSVRVGAHYHPGLAHKGGGNADAAYLDIISQTHGAGGPAGLADINPDDAHAAMKDTLKWYQGYSGETARIREVAELMDRYETLNDENDPLVPSYCSRGTSTYACMANERTRIQDQIWTSKVIDFIVPGTALDVALSATGGTKGVQGLAKLGRGGAASRLQDLAPDQLSYKRLLDGVDELDVTTIRNQSVFYSGRGAREAAEEHAKSRGLTTLEQTAGGRHLDGLKLFDGTVDDVGRDQATNVWRRVSSNYASQAAGDVTAIVNNPSRTGIFLSQELPILLQNPNVAKVTVRATNGAQVSIPRGTAIDDALRMLEGF